MNYVMRHCLCLLTSKISQMPWAFLKSLTKWACIRCVSAAGKSFFFQLIHSLICISNRGHYILVTIWQTWVAGLKLHTKLPTKKYNFSCLILKLINRHGMRCFKESSQRIFSFGLILIIICLFWLAKLGNWVVQVHPEHLCHIRARTLWRSWLAIQQHF